MKVDTKMDALNRPSYSATNGNGNASDRNAKDCKLKLNTLKVVNSANNSSQISINLLLLLVSSMNSIDGISVGGIFTLNFSVIAKFLSALFTFGILFIELTRAESH